MVDNLITLYEHNETEFKTNGLGSLIDAAACEVHEERNGEFELTMEYPVTGRHFSDLIMRRIIFARPNPHDNAQPFRIYSISKPINGVITINARHISYDLDGYSLAPFDKSSLLDVFEEMNNQMKQPWNSDKPPFHFSTTKTGAASMFNLVAPCSMRAILGGSEGTILDRWPGEYEWDIWEVKYHQNRGADRGVTIEYGKNLTNLEQEESCDNCWTAVYPYYYTDPQTDDEGVTTGGLVELDEKIVKLSGTYNYSRTLILDLTSDFEEMPTQSQLRERAQQYIEDNEIGSPSVSLTVSFLPLSETTAYSKLKILEEVKLCDTVHVYFPRLNVASTAMCISTTYNVLTNKYTEIELGDAKSDLASTLAGQGNDTEKRIQSALNSNNSFLEEAIKRQTKMITGNLGGYVVLHDTNGDGMPDELLIMDHENVEDAVNIWRANQTGVGHSSTGYNGDYTTGWTMDGHFNASLITVGELWANIIKVGILSDQKGYNYWNLETGEFRMAATAMVGDQTISDIANAALNDAKQYTNDSVGNFIEDTYNPKVAELQRQIDGQIETYYYDHEPTLQNEPASLWTNDTEKARHEGDLFYWKTKGYAYRFFKDGNTWKWQMVQDTDITQALERAKDAKDTADNKRRVFVSTPVPPYDIGDLWVQGPEGDIYRCQRNKTGGSFDQGDWILASKYTDDSALNTFLTGDYKTTISNLTTQVDQKAETWFQNNDPSSAWNTPALKTNHIGDMWYCTDPLKATYYGKYWLWNGTKWAEMNTNPPQAVFDEIDGKAQIFINTPTVPYSEGDLWFQSDTSDIMTCIKSRTSGPFTQSEWEKRNKYIDLTVATDTATTQASNAVNNQSQEFIFNKLTNNKKIQGLYMQNGQLYINAQYIATGKISSKNGKVYFDLDGNELACNRLISTLESRYPQATLVFNSAQVSGGGYQTYLNMSLKDNPDAHLGFYAPADGTATIESGIHGLELKGADSSQYGNMRLYLGGGPTIGGVLCARLQTLEASISVTEQGSIYLDTNSIGYVYLGGRVCFTRAQIPYGAVSDYLAITATGELTVGSSSEQYKEIQRPLKSSDVDDLYNITPVLAKYKDEIVCDADERKGVYYPMLVAEDVNKYAPYIVNHDENGNCKNWQERIIIPCMFQMLKDQKKQIDILTERLDRLEGGV